MQKLTVKKNANYTTIANYHLRDERLSWKAKGLLTYLLHLPESWEIFMNQLYKSSSDGKDSVNSIIAELEKFTYVSRILKDENNTRKGYDFVVSETPMNGDNTYAENPLSLCGKSAKDYAENPHNRYAENPHLLNTNIVNTKSKEILPNFYLEKTVENLDFSLLKNHNVRYNVLAGLLHKGFGISETDYANYVDEFKSTLQLRNDLDKDKFDLKKHFGAWILKELEKKNNISTQPAGNKSPVYKPFIRKVS